MSIFKIIIMSKRTRITCNICFEQFSDIKCNECTFETCYLCLYKWYEKSFKCPQCNQLRTFDINYDDFENDDEFDDIDDIDDMENVYDFQIPLFAFIGTFVSEDQLPEIDMDSHADSETLESAVSDPEPPVPYPDSDSDSDFDSDSSSDTDSSSDDDSVPEINDEHSNYNYFTVNPVINPIILPPPPPSPSPSV